MKYYYLYQGMIFKFIDEKHVNIDEDDRKELGVIHTYLYLTPTCSLLSTQLIQQSYNHPITLLIKE